MMKNRVQEMPNCCVIFGVGKVLYNFSTMSSRQIGEGIPFCILGGTQIQNAAKIIARMDQGHGLVDRFLLTVPLVLQPTPQQQEFAYTFLNNFVISDFSTVFSAIANSHTNCIRMYKLDEEARETHNKMLENFTLEFNDAIKNGKMAPKSKKPELIPRVAVALHVLTHFLKCAFK